MFMYPGIWNRFFTVINDMIPFVIWTFEKLLLENCLRSRVQKDLFPNVLSVWDNVLSV